jgi:hypothetical protein
MPLRGHEHGRAVAVALGMSILGSLLHTDRTMTYVIVIHGAQLKFDTMAARGCSLFRSSVQNETTSTCLVGCTGLNGFERVQAVSNQQTFVDLRF